MNSSEGGGYRDVGQGARRGFHGDWVKGQRTFKNSSFVPLPKPHSGLISKAQLTMPGAEQEVDTAIQTKFSESVQASTVTAPLSRSILWSMGGKLALRNYEEFAQHSNDVLDNDEESSSGGTDSIFMIAARGVDEMEHAIVKIQDAVRSKLERLAEAKNLFKKRSRADKVPDFVYNLLPGFNPENYEDDESYQKGLAAVYDIQKSQILLDDAKTGAQMLQRGSKTSRARLFQDVWDASTVCLANLLMAPGKIFTNDALNQLIDEKIKRVWATSPPTAAVQVEYVLKRLGELRLTSSVRYAHNELLQESPNGQFHDSIACVMACTDLFEKQRRILEKAPIAFHELRVLLRGIPMQNSLLAGIATPFWALDYEKVTQETVRELTGRLHATWGKSEDIAIRLSKPHKEISALVVHQREDGRTRPGQGGGRGRGSGDYAKGRGRGRAGVGHKTDGRSVEQSEKSGDQRTVVCYTCGGPHYSRDCPRRHAASTQAGAKLSATEAQSSRVENDTVTVLRNSQARSARGKVVTIAYGEWRASASEPALAVRASARKRPADPTWDTPSEKRLIVDTGAGAHCTPLRGSHPTPFEGEVIMADGRRVLVHETSDIDMQIAGSGRFVLQDAWRLDVHPDDDVDTLLSLGAALEDGAIAHFTKDERYLEFPGSKRIYLDKNFSVTFNTTASRPTAPSHRAEPAKTATAYWDAPLRGQELDDLQPTMSPGLYVVKAGKPVDTSGQLKHARANAASAPWNVAGNGMRH